MALSLLPVAERSVAAGDGAITGEGVDVCRDVPVGRPRRLHGQPSASHKKNFFFFFFFFFKKKKKKKKKKKSSGAGGGKGLPGSLGQPSCR